MCQFSNQQFVVIEPQLWLMLFIQIQITCLIKYVNTFIDNTECNWIIVKHETWKRRLKNEFTVCPNVHIRVPWLCTRLIETNPRTIVEYRCLDDGHFMQLFVYLLVSIHEFKMGCRPIISIDSSHMSGPYKGTLFSVSLYDADDDMFPLAYCLFSSKNYKDWLWFLEKLKMVIGERKVIIIFDRQQRIICSVSEVFGSENHVVDPHLGMSHFFTICFSRSHV